MSSWIDYDANNALHNAIRRFHSSWDGANLSAVVESVHKISVAQKLYSESPSNQWPYRCASTGQESSIEVEVSWANRSIGCGVTTSARIWVPEENAWSRRASWANDHVVAQLPAKSVPWNSRWCNRPNGNGVTVFANSGWMGQMEVQKEERRTDAEYFTVPRTFLWKDTGQQLVYETVSTHARFISENILYTIYMKLLCIFGIIPRKCEGKHEYYFDQTCAYKSIYIYIYIWLRYLRWARSLNVHAIRIYIYRIYMSCDCHVTCNNIDFKFPKHLVGAWI